VDLYYYIGKGLKNHLFREEQALEKYFLLKCIIANEEIFVNNYFSGLQGKKVQKTKVRR